MKHKSLSRCLTAAFFAAVTAGMPAADSYVAHQPAVAKNPLDAKILAKTENLKKPAERKTVRKIRNRVSTEAETISFTGAFQSFHEYYEFNYDGGEFLTYDVYVILDGKKATISNLFNLIDGYPYDNSEQFDINGTFDEKTNTITIPTPTEFDLAEQVGLVYGYYPLTMISGKVDAEGGITPAKELVITLSPDHKRATFDKDFGLRMYTPEGASQGFKCIYKGGVMKADLSVPETICFTEKIDFGKCWVNSEKEKELKVFNLGGKAVEAAVALAGNAFATHDSKLSLIPMESTPVYVTAKPASPGIAEGKITIGKDIAIGLSCTAENMPDYSFIVKNGDFTFNTDSDRPFVRDTKNGVDVARSNNDASVSDSFLEVKFSVPEGKLGRFSWKGWSSNEVSYGSFPSILADERQIFSYEGLLDTQIDNSYTFGPGEHTLAFNYSVNSVSYFTENDRMWVYGLNLDIEDLAENKAQLLTEKVRFPNSVLFEATAEKTEYITLRNEGANPLKVTGMTAPGCIKAETPDYEAATLETLEIPVTFTASKAGEYKGEIAINTSAGDFRVPYAAFVRDMPDFQKIVKEGEFTFTTDEENPFLVENGKAFNSTAKVKDEDVTYSSMTADFTVPEGKLGILSWKGRVSCMPYDEMGWTDFLSLTVSHNSGMKVSILPGEYDLSTEFYPYVDEPDMSSLTCPPGPGYVTFNYTQYGDGVYGGDDIVEVYDLSLKLIDNEPHSAILVTEDVTFPEIYQGKVSSAKAVLHNTGTEELEVLSVKGDGLFDGDIPSRKVPFNQKIEVPLYFMPTEAGEQDGSVTITTSAGDFTVKCSGNAISTEGMLLVEDFEDDAYGWSLYDRDGDSDNWNLAYNVYGGITAGHVHSGEECLVSFSWDYVNGTFTPDNWTFSPSFTVPATGAFLTWYVAGDDNSRLGDKYSVYVSEGEFARNAFDIEKYTLVYSDEIVTDEWIRRIVDLSKFAGKKLHVAFRHHDSEGLYMVKIDDVFVYNENPSGIGEISLPDGAGCEYYTIDGMRVRNPESKGIYIVKNPNGKVTKSIAR